MALDPAEVDLLDQRAQKVGLSIGWDLRFVVAPNPEYVGITAAAIDQNDEDVSQIFVIGPNKRADLATHDIEMDLALLASGERQIVLDEGGDPRLL